jgi:signal transduction histidine kinase
VLERETGAVFDRGRLRQALSILLDNAVKYTPQGGRVSVKGMEEDGSVKIEVSDTGIGISEEQIPHVFDRFYRAEEARSTEGSGLGLAIARQIAEDHGGTLEQDRARIVLHHAHTAPRTALRDMNIDASAGNLAKDRGLCRRVYGLVR